MTFSGVKSHNILHLFNERLLDITPLSHVTGGPGAGLLSQPASVAAPHRGVCGRASRIQRRQAHEVSVTGPNVHISDSRSFKSAASFTFLCVTFTSPPLNLPCRVGIAASQPAALVGCRPKGLAVVQ